ncbi:hypothetical protein B7463_g7041, partial [Scytalidium lignicola]
MAQIQESFTQTKYHIDIPTKDLLSWIFHNQLYNQDKPILIDTENTKNSLSSKQCKSLIRKLIAGFHATGLKQGDCVYYPCIFLAIIGSGLVFTGTNPSYTPFELVHHIRISKSKMIITEADISTNIMTAAKECDISDDRILFFNQDEATLPLASSNIRSWFTLFQHGEADWQRFDNLSTAKKTTACRLFTSGTTGLPKAAPISHYNLIAQHTLLHEQVKKPYEVKRILCLPFFHAAMIPMAMATPLRLGHIGYIMRRFELEKFLQVTESHAITEFFLVPPIIISILTSQLTARYSLKSIRWGVIGGAPIDETSRKQISELVHPDGRINMVWGMTECTCVGASFSWPEGDDTGSIGRFLPTLEVKLVDDEGKPIQDYNTTGEICIRGPTIIGGYFENPQANAESFENGWFHTGDIAFCDKDTEKWYIELIKVRGFQVAPAELEEVLLKHPDIIEAAVIGVQLKHIGEGEVPRAYVVQRSGLLRNLTKENLKDFVSRRLAKYKRLDGGVIFVENLPKSASGKILKRELRERAKLEVLRAHL